MSDLDWLAEEIISLKKQVRTIGRASQASFRSITVSDGPLTFTDVDGNVVGETTVDEETGVPVYKPVLTVAVPTPTAPDAIGIVDGVNVVWDGTFEDGNWSPGIVRVEIHKTALPDDPYDDTTQVGTFVSPVGGTYMVPGSADDGISFYRLVAVAATGIESPASFPDGAIPLSSATAEDLAALEVELDLLDTALTTAQADIAANEAATAANATALTAAQAELDNLNDVVIPGINTELATAQDSINMLETVTIPALESDLATAQGQIDTLNTVTIPGINSELDTAQADIDAAETAIASNATAISAAQSSIDNLEDTVIPGLNADIAAAQSDLDTLNTVTIPGINSDLAAANVDIAALEAFDAGVFPIVETDIQDGAITTPKMTANSIDGDRITANTLNASKIVAGSITSDRMTANSITGDRIQANTLDAAKIVAGSITTDRMTANTISGTVIAAGTLNADKIVAGSITTTQMTADSINGDRITSNTLNASKIVAGSITSDRMTANTITGDRIQANTLDAAKIVAGSITTDRMTADSINGDRISAGTLNATKITAGSITTDRMTADSINGDRISAGTLNASKIVAGSITTTQMTANTINGDRITTNTLNADRIVSGSITTDRMTANTISGDRITTNTLNADRIVAGSITTDRMTANTINGDRITTNTLNADKIVANSITTAKLAATAIDGMTITGALIQSETTAARGVKLSSTGFTAYNSSGVATFDVSASTGNVTMTGTLDNPGVLASSNNLTIRPPSGTAGGRLYLDSNGGPIVSGGGSATPSLKFLSNWTGVGASTNLAYPSRFSASMYLGEDGTLYLGQFDGSNQRLKIEAGLNVESAIVLDAEAWTSVATPSGFTSVQTLQYRMDAAGNVHLRGALTIGAATTGATLFTLPAAYRPTGAAWQAMCRTNANNVPCRILVNTTGTVVANWAAGTTAIGIETVFTVN